MSGSVGEDADDVGAPADVVPPAAPRTSFLLRHPGRRSSCGTPDVVPPAAPRTSFLLRHPGRRSSCGTPDVVPPAGRPVVVPPRKVQSSGEPDDASHGTVVERKDTSVDRQLLAQIGSDEDEVAAVAAGRGLRAGGE